MRVVVNHLVVALLKQMTPDGDVGNSQAFLDGFPGHNLHSRSSPRSMEVADRLERGHEVRVCRCDNSDIEVLTGRIEDQIDRELNVNALLLGRLSWPGLRVSQRTREYFRATRLPRRLLPEHRSV